MILLEFAQALYKLLIGNNLSREELDALGSVLIELAQKASNKHFNQMDSTTRAEYAAEIVLKAWEYYRKGKGASSFFGKVKGIPSTEKDISIYRGLVSGKMNFIASDLGRNAATRYRIHNAFKAVTGHQFSFSPNMLMIDKPIEEEEAFYNQFLGVFVEVITSVQKEENQEN